MSRRAQFNSPAAIRRRIEEGRGCGDDSSYRRWLDTSDVPSLGRRHRLFFPKFQRPLHLLSDLERNCAYLSEYRPDVKSNREQFPLLPLTETQEIAKELGILRHPRFGNYDVVMTTDQVWIVVTTAGQVTKPISVKYADEMTDSRVLAKHRIEATYWKRRGCDLSDFDEKSVGRVFVRNWGLVRGTLRKDYFRHFPARLAERVAECIGTDATSGSWTLEELAIRGAIGLGVPQGSILTAIYYLIASRTWPVDLEANLLTASQKLTFIPGGPK